MAVSVSRDLTVQVLEDANVVKLTDRQQALRSAVQRGEPKCLGVSQVMLGLMVMCYSIPLHVTEITEVVRLGVPWWSGITFVAAGAIAIVLDKNCTMKTLQLCLLLSLLSVVTSLVAVIIYSVDVHRNVEIPCSTSQRDTMLSCAEQHFTEKLSVGVKSNLLLFTLVQLVISTIVSVLLYRQRSSFGHYSSLTGAAPSSPEALIPPTLR